MTTDGDDAGALHLLSRARKDLAEARTTTDYLLIMNSAEIARILSERMRFGLEASNEATAIHLHAAAGLARAVKQGQDEGTIAKQGDAGRGRPIDSTGGSIYPERVPVGPTVMRDCRLVAIAAEHNDIDDLATEATLEGKQLTKSSVTAIGRAIESGILPGQADDWYTPPWLFDALAVRFDIDVCAPTDPACRSCPADRYLTEQDNGLEQDWHGLVWCNPPYSDAGPWTARMLDHGNGILLTHIPANAAWAVDVWRRADAAVFLQAVEFARPNGQHYRPGYALQLAGIGTTGAAAVARCARVTPKAGALWTRV